MTAPSKVKTWRDGEGLVQQSNAEEASKDEQENKTSKPKTEPRAREISTAPPQTPKVEDLPSTNVIDQDPSHAQTGSSDMDWMRSRTSRLLGLIEDDDDEAEERRTPIEGHEEQDLEVAKPDELEATLNEENKDVVDGGAQNAATTLEVQGLDSPEAQAIHQSGRLFLRNLAYDVSEDALREHFSHFGDLTEVSSISTFHGHFCVKG